MLKAHLVERFKDSKVFFCNDTNVIVKPVTSASQQNSQRAILEIQVLTQRRKFLGKYAGSARKNEDNGKLA